MINEELLNKIITEEINRELLSEGNPFFNFGGRMGSWLTNQNTGNVLGSNGGINFRNGNNGPNTNIFSKIRAAINPKNWAWNRERNFVQKTGMSFQQHAEQLATRIKAACTLLNVGAEKLKELPSNASEFIQQQKQEQEKEKQQAQNNAKNANAGNATNSNPAQGEGSTEGSDASGGQSSTATTQNGQPQNGTPQTQPQNGTPTAQPQTQQDITAQKGANTVVKGFGESISNIENLMLLLEDNDGGGDDGMFGGDGDGHSMGWSKEYASFRSIRYQTKQANEQIYKNLCNLLVLCKSSNKFFGGKDTCVKNYDTIQRLCLQGGTIHKLLDDSIDNAAMMSQSIQAADAKKMNDSGKLEQLVNVFKKDISNMEKQVENMTTLCNKISELVEGTKGQAEQAASNDNQGGTTPQGGNATPEHPIPADGKENELPGSPGQGGGYPQAQAINQDELAQDLNNRGNSNQG